MNIENFRSDLKRFDLLFSHVSGEIRSSCAKLLDADDPRACVNARDDITLAVVRLAAHQEHLEEVLSKHAMFSFTMLGEGPLKEVAASG